MITLAERGTIVLSKQEEKILKLIAKGYNNDEVANILYVSTHTIKAHLKSIYIKLDVNNRTSAVYKALKSELID